MAFNLTTFLVTSVVFFTLWALMLLYFKIAIRFGIIDKPNHRSSHQEPTVRGGGIIILFALLIWFFWSGFQIPWFFFGALIIALVSFADDILTLPAAFRTAVQVLAFALMGWQTGLYALPLILVGVIIVIGIGTINAFNFMDGINGITGVYALVNLVTFFLIQHFVINYTNDSLILFMGIGVCVFLIFNFRKKARCFAGDVGSVLLAFIQLFFVMQLILKTGNYGWILIFLVYGVDSVVTIVYRIRNRENIFEAHRSHLYQYLSNELGISHLRVSLLYGALQVAINLILIRNLMTVPVWIVLIGVIITGIIYVGIREWVLNKIGKEGLLVKRKG